MRTPISQTDRAGFTLVELTVVVVILGLASALVVARMDSLLPSRRLESAADRLVAAVRFARVASRIRRVEVTVEYDLDEGAWSVVAPLPLPPLPEETDFPDDTAEPYLAAGREDILYEPEVLDEGIDTLLVGRLPDDVKMTGVHYSESGLVTSGAVTASFRPSGAVGEHMVILENSTGNSLAVYVPALSGAAFLVDDGSSYAQIRSQRRLQ